MATKNGVCPYCQFNRLENRIFRVNPEASTVFCPSCMRELDPKKAIGLYDSIIGKMVDKADETLFVACDPADAYLKYADVLEFEPENSKALFGRILCLIYTSKIRKSYLNEANSLLENINQKGNEEISNYVAALKKINFALDEYETALSKKLSFHNYFYEEDCIKLYFRRVYEIFKFKSDILDRVLRLKKDYSSQKNEMFANLLNHSVKEKEDILKSNKYLINGQGYRLVKIVGDNVYIEQVKEVADFHYPKKHSYTLGEGDRHHKTIKDQLFRDYTPIIKMKTAALIIGIFLFAVAAGFGVASYLYFSEKLFFYIFAGAGALALIGSVTLLILFLIWNGILKKRQMRID